MATNSNEFDDVLRRAKSLTDDQQQRLIAELSSQPPSKQASNGVRTVYQALSEMGLIGSITDAPPGLSTDPKYLEGFGSDSR